MSRSPSRSRSCSWRRATTAARAESAASIARDSVARARPAARRGQRRGSRVSRGATRTPSTESPGCSTRPPARVVDARRCHGRGAERVQRARRAGSPSAEGFIGPSCASPARDDQQRCLHGYLAKSDVVLDRSYQALITRLKAEAKTKAGAPEPPSVQRLRDAQRAWLVYRDDECRKRTVEREGPLWAPVRAQVPRRVLGAALARARGCAGEAQGDRRRASSRRSRRRRAPTRRRRVAAAHGGDSAGLSSERDDRRSLIAHRFDATIAPSHSCASSFSTPARRRSSSSSSIPTARRSPSRAIGGWRAGRWSASAGRRSSRCRGRRGADQVHGADPRSRGRGGARHRLARRARSPACAIDSVGEIEAVGHRVVHGGERFTHSTRIDDDGAARARGAHRARAAPQPAQPARASPRRAAALGPGMPQVAVFDTAFHHSLPDTRLPLRDPVSALPAPSRAPLRLPRHVAPVHRVPLPAAHRRARARRRRSSRCISATARRRARSTAATRSTRRWASRRSRGS